MIYRDPADCHDMVFSVRGAIRRHAEIAGQNNSLHVSTAFVGLVIDF